jgi:poly-gamma-glutamate capsule biosynthesis protein CapA/YwtB (metallophosphatase superfamily)
MLTSRLAGDRVWRRVKSADNPSSYQGCINERNALFLFLTLLVLLVVVGIKTQILRPKHEAPDLSNYPWLYLRGGEPLASGENVVELIAVGDVMLGRGVASEPRPFAAVTPWLRAADLALGNLECVIAPGGTPCPGPSDEPALQPYRLCAPPSAVTALREAGFDVLGLANNHALDLDPAGLAETVSRLQMAGIAPVGAGPNAEAALWPLIRQVEGVRLAFLAFNAVPDPAGTGLTKKVPDQSEDWTRAGWDREQIAAAIAAARARADAVIVSVHWGYEYETRADPAQRDAANCLLEAGADLVLGHHPHVVQGCRVTDEPDGGQPNGGRFVAYSLGNFVFDQEQGETRQGLALRAFFDDQGLRAVQALPVWAGPRPRLMTLDEATPLLARVQPPPGRLGFTCDSQACYPVEVPQIPETGLFWAGEIDLTGDGVPERVRRAGEQVIVYRDGVEAWQSPLEWQVVDLALGDPNDDGRGELLLALWKHDTAGVLRSHPFIIGCREGAYRILWGGSAVSDPLHEVELGDVDGDNVQELIVLEEQGDGSNRAVTVWRWHGWGFSLNWRSSLGRYRDLALIPGEAGYPPIISVATEP